GLVSTVPARDEALYCGTPWKVRLRDVVLESLSISLWLRIRPIKRVPRIGPCCLLFTMGKETTIMGPCGSCTRPFRLPVGSLCASSLLQELLAHWKYSGNSWGRSFS